MLIDSSEQANLATFYVSEVSRNNAKQLLSWAAGHSIPVPIKKSIANRHSMALPPHKPYFVRRIALLCCHFARNVAYYRIGYINEDGTGGLKQASEFGATVNGNMMDIAVLEWGKLFTDRRGSQHWHKFVRIEPERRQFLASLIQSVGLNDAGWRHYLDEFRVYRDKFVAHLDTEDCMRIPNLEIALQSTFFLYSHLLANAPGGTFDAPHRATLPYDLLAYYVKCQSEARLAYAMEQH